MQTPADHAPDKLLVMEEHFLDIVRFKINSLFNFLNVSTSAEREIKSFLEELQTLTKKNIQLLKKYDD
ncbi:hypothetical protein COV06_00410 [Candidatus Uhrbacteria bacterium CG10_big_fil_rev_8_21_14_0_10_50_16]|uniref:Four helix bundle protein n=1 Tax=Candidatus Uhrbacteria bacterium CG10_big_fil_rev_8_21_14_0_10_50_16 TaxID=1975039 RepID=A0A2H0RMS3_9BACT|nr:MAG: hypothetical protein COV06_00410 [Candidatus Uhrbacteria bacterium CG10_big_fil_rev_8_21_14_0_10_50_16]